MICAVLFHFDKELILKKSEVIGEFNEFSKDATTLTVIGNDLDFLLDTNCQEQYEKIKKLKDDCIILCNELIKPSNFYLDSKEEDAEKYRKLVGLYNELLESNVRIKCFPTKIDEKYEGLKRILGQVKETTTTKKIKLVTKVKKKFRNIDLQYIPIIDILNNQIIEMHSLAKNPVIKCIAVDIGGVAFEGKIDDFYNRLYNEMRIKILKNAFDKVNLDLKLSLGEIDICKVIEEKVNNKLSKPQKEKIKMIWNTTWKPHKGVYEILKELCENGYEIVFMSNIDSINANYYKTHDYFSDIPTCKFFFSCEKKVCKPSQDSFKTFEKEFMFLPNQILLIDDQSDNINAAYKAKWKTLKFDITTMKLEELREGLENMSLLRKTIKK